MFAPFCAVGNPAANNCRHENCRLAATIRITCQQFTYFFCSQRWFATLQEVLLADWQDVWHSPQPAFFRSSLRFLVLIVLILFMMFLRILLRRAPRSYIVPKDCITVCGCHATALRHLCSRCSQRCLEPDHKCCSGCQAIALVHLCSRCSQRCSRAESPALLRYLTSTLSGILR